jgi:hypothetical protein
MNRRGFVKSGMQAIAARLLCQVQHARAAGQNPYPALGQQGPGLSAMMPLYDYDPLKWLYIGWEADHPKSWTFMGGGVAPGTGNLIQYALANEGKVYFPDEFAPNRKSAIQWFLSDGYLPCPISRWMAGPLQVEIQHFANRILSDQVTAVYSRVRVTNPGSSHHKPRLTISSLPDIEIPLTGECTELDSTGMHFDLSLEPGGAIVRDFVALAAGSQVEPAALKSAGGFDSNYDSMARYWKGRMSGLTEPINLPVKGMVEMYKSIQITIWESIVKTDDGYEVRASPRNPFNNATYDRTFSHDTPNYVDQLMRMGDFDLGKRVLASKYYHESDSTSWKGLAAGDPVYEDTIGKYILPYAEYLRCSGDLSYFTTAVREELHKAAQDIHASRTFEDSEHYGLMKKSQDFENWANDGDYLLCDNWSALHGLQAYRYICEQIGDKSNAEWAAKEIIDLNDCLNGALDRSCSRRRTEYYDGGFDDVTLDRYRDSIYSWVPYSGALSTFPWGAYLKGFELGGFWKDKFDASIRHALAVRDHKQIPGGSWGTWWGQVTYGSDYNCSAGLQCLYSEAFRAEVAKNLEFQLDNQCVPFNWSEAFEYKGRDQWAGMYVPPVSYGNFESWGASFSNQALLQVCASVKTDGTVIIGRGIPDYWLEPGSVIEWANVNVNQGRKISFRITAVKSEIRLRIWGDIRNGEVHLNLPVLKNNIAASDAGRIDNEKGLVALSPSTHSVSVKLRNPPAGRRA